MGSFIYQYIKGFYMAEQNCENCSFRAKYDNNFDSKTICGVRHEFH